MRSRADLLVTGRLPWKEITLWPPAMCGIEPYVDRDRNQGRLTLLPGLKSKSLAVASDHVGQEK